MATPRDPRFAVFLSYSRGDEKVVERIARRLREEGLEPWLDAWCLTPGTVFHHEMAAGIEESAACAVFVGAGGLGAWERQEVDLALDRAAKEPGFRVFAVLLPGLATPFDPNSLPGFLRTRTWVDYRGGAENTRAFHDLSHAIHGLPFGTDAPNGDTGQDVCPYLGLRAFHEDDADFFFGRDAEVQRLVEKLRATRFLGVIGPSGSGKSSLTRAGLIPALRAGGALDDSANWAYATLRPGAAPLTALAAALVNLTHAPIHESLDRLTADPRCLHLAIAQALAGGPADRRAVVVIDQFEEVFALAHDEHERQMFCANLVYAATAVGGQTIVVLTLRADFYARCAAYPELAQMLSASQFLVAPITAEGLRAAVEEPAHRVGLRLEDGLVETILADAGAEPGSLPLLEHALFELWRRRHGHLLTLAAYREAGGVAGALATRAEVGFASLGTAQQVAARRLLLRLTEPGEGVEDTRRRATVAEVAGAADADAAQHVVRVLADARLLTTGVNAGTGEATVEVSHEALIRGWPRLRSWIEEDRSGLLVHHGITSAANDWQRLGRDPSALYRGARLATAREWESVSGQDLNDIERQFLALSVAAEQNELHLARRRARQLRALTLALAVGIVGVFVLALVARTERNNAQADARRAERQAALGLSTTLGNESFATWKARPDVALLLAIQAYETADTYPARRALVVSAESMRQVGRAHVLPAENAQFVAFDPQGDILATAGLDGAMQLWGARSRKKLGSPLLGHHGAVAAVAFSPDGQTLASANADGTIGLWSVARRQPLGSGIYAHAGAVESIAFSPDGQTLASAGADGIVRLWSVVGHQEIGQPLVGHTQSVESVAFSPDGRTLASASADGTVRLWSVARQKELGAPLRSNTSPVFAVRFSPDGHLLASAGGDGDVRFWDVEGHHRSGMALAARTGYIDTIAFAPDGLTIASAGVDGAVRIWDVAHRRAIGQPLRGNAGALGALAYSPNGQVLATAGAGAVRLWDLSSRRQLVAPLGEHLGEVESIAFSPSRNVLASADADGTVRLWDADSRREIAPPLPGNAGPADAVAFSPDGKMLASGGDDGSVRIWDTESHEEIGGPLVTEEHNAIYGLTFSPDGRTLASGGFDGTIQLWDVVHERRLGAPLRTSSPSVIFTLSFSPDGHTLASGMAHAITDNYDSVRLWDVADHKSIGTLHVEGNSAESLAFSPSGSILATANGTSAQLWDVKTLKAIGRPLPKPIMELHALAFSPGGHTLAGVGAKSIWLWDVDSRKLLGDPLVGEAGDLTKVAISADDRRLASVGAGGRIWIWSLPLLEGGGKPSDILDALCPLVGRNLSRTEWARYVSGTPYRKTCPQFAGGN